MPTDFFCKEVERLQQRFNQTFGRLNTCDISLRQSVILTICGLGCLGKKIVKAKRDSDVREGIQEFNKIRNRLNNIFNTIEVFQAERRNLFHEGQCSNSTKKHLGQN